jgi:predicted alpha/beta superfamily hydrolase
LERVAGTAITIARSIHLDELAMRLFSFVLATVLCSAVGVAAAAAAIEPQPYALKDTEVQTLHAAHLGRDYELFVSLPASYAAGSRSYPVVFVTDAPYAFPLTRAIEARVTGHSQELPEFILVGLGYGKGDTPEYSRRRDYTPSAHGVRGATSDMAGRPVAFGEAEGYRRFVADEVFPFVASHYRADMHRKVFAGHSYGSLFGAWVLTTAPEMFDGYVLGSPSLWYDDYLLAARERAFAGAHKDLAARVYLGAGEFEARAPKSRAHDARFSTDSDMVADMQAFGRALASHRYPGLRLRTDVIAGEDHLTVAPALITRGLLWTLGTK